MAQSLIDISMEAFQLQLWRMSVPALKATLREIYSWKMDNKNKLDPEHEYDRNLILNIERKETKIWRELQKRGYLGKKDYNDFYQMLSTINKKKVVF